MNDTEFGKPHNSEECADIRDFLFQMMEKRIKCVDKPEESEAPEFKDDGIKLLASSNCAICDDNATQNGNAENGESKRKKPKKHKRKVDSDSDSSEDEEKRQRKFESISVDAGFIAKFK
ncbi:hypothetical protein L596_018574 [Steinernema carpocapsae]|uniref:Uncharacterized protein n=1 Tax=Steinernema carpocapsae TaxID=34508 RepID=A0A4U5N638_STECR|nr:hypothetical protein L596_018574 [Steinernema carpocapsae]